MSQPSIRIPHAAAEALSRGNTIEAVRIVRDTSGMDLKQAHALVQQFAEQARHPAPAQSPMRVGNLVIPPAAAAALQRGEFIEAIALLRGANPNLDLKTAKQAVDHLRSSRSAPAAHVAHASAMPKSQRVPTVVEGDSGGHRSLLVLAFIAMAVALWWLFFSPG